MRRGNGTRDMNVIDDPGAEQLCHDGCVSMRPMAVALIARTDPVLCAMLDLVETLLRDGRQEDVVPALEAFYGEDARNVARRLVALVSDPAAALIAMRAILVDW